MSRVPRAGLSRWRRSPYLPRTYLDELRLFPYSVHRIVAIGIGLILLIGYPFIASSFFVNVANFAMIAVVGAVGLQFVTGMAGQLSLGHAGFLAIGAFTAAALHIHWSLPFIVGLPAAGIAGAIGGLMAGLPALRLRGLYLGITTLATQSIVLVLALRYQLYLQDTLGTGSDLTLPIPDVLVTQLTGARTWYWFLAAMATGVVLIGANVRRSSIGRDWIALRSGEVAAEALGVRVQRRKVQAFVISSALGSMAGAMSAYYFRSVTVEDFGLLLSVEYLAMIIIGGLGSVTGAVLGAVFLTSTSFMVGEVIDVVGLSSVVGNRIRAVELGIFAVLAVLFLLLEPTGLVGVWRRVKSYFARWPYGYEDQTRGSR